MHWDYIRSLVMGLNLTIWINKTKKSTFHIFNTLFYRLGLEFNLLTWGLGKFPKVVSLWLCMQFSTLIIVYPGFYGWSVYRPEGKAGKHLLLYYYFL
jgi:hypothetical protein